MDDESKSHQCKKCGKVAAGELSVLLETGWKCIGEEKEESLISEDSVYRSFLLCPDCLALIESASHSII